VFDGFSDEDDVVQDELVTGFDKFGVERCVNSFPYFLQSSQLTEVVIDATWLTRLHENRKKKNQQEPLVIPALKNKDWRELARKRRSAQQYMPSSAKVHDGVDGSVGGLGTKDTIGAGPVLSGLQLGKKTVKVEVDESTEIKKEVVVEDIKLELSEEEVARRAILAEAHGLASNNPSVMDIIPMPMSEEDAYKQDVEELPEVASLEDYARVPVEQFGAAMLRGMGWTEGTAASKTGKGRVQPYLPTARPALLGIGAKEMEAFDDGTQKKNKGSSRPEKRYVPVVKREREKKGDTPGSGRERSQSPNYSRRNSPSADSNNEHNGHRRRGESDYRRDRNRERERERERDYRDKAKDRYQYREKEHLRERNGDQPKRDRQVDFDHNRSDRGDRSRDSSRRRDY